MTDVETLRALLARVEGAAGADREIDGLIAQAFGDLFQDAYWSPLDTRVDETGHWVIGGYGDYQFPDVDAYTASVDAALALVGRVMPEAAPSVGMNVHHGVWYGHITGLDDNGVPITLGGVTHSTPALALLAALLRAKIAETDNG